jgi:small subunit ribosomal protein S6
MRQYETVFIVHPDLGEEDTTALVDRYQQILETHRARILKVDVWGRRTLAYMIRKQTKGVYVLFEYGAQAEAVFELERNFKIDEQILRFLTVMTQPRFQPPAEEEPPEETDTEAAAPPAEEADPPREEPAKPAEASSTEPAQGEAEEEKARED